MAGGNVHKLAMNGPALIDALDRTIGRQPLNSLADFHRWRRRRQRLAEGNTHGVAAKGESLGPFPEEFAAAITEDASPNVVQANWDDRRGTAFEDLLEPSVKRQEKA